MFYIVTVILIVILGICKMVGAVCVWDGNSWHALPEEAIQRMLQQETPPEQVPAEPILFITGVGNSGLALEPSTPIPTVARFIIACANEKFMCSDNGAAFHHCTRRELSDVGLMHPRFVSGKCLAERRTNPEQGN